MENTQKHVVVAMSGGVDSSTVAALLKEQGYQVTGMMLRLWSEDGKEELNRCCTPDSIFTAKRVAAILGIPFYVVDAKTDFYSAVVEYFLDGYAAGNTPNPCILCNKRIRWGKLFDHALELDADFFATGHYARVIHAHDGRSHLFTGVDKSKDQSYVLSMLNQEQLAKTMLPLGGLTKKEVRAHASRLQLPVAEKADSQDLCFLGDSDYMDFIKKYRPESLIAGPIITADGDIIGQHNGLAGFTIGQRKGIGIADQEPYYVVAKDVANNALVVGKKANLQISRFLAVDFNWIEGLPKGEFMADVMIRYRASRTTAHVRVLEPGIVLIQLTDSRPDIAQSQLAVIYKGDEVLGGGIIKYEERI